MTPFEVAYGRTQPSIAKFIRGETLVQAVTQDLWDRDEALRQLRFHLQQVQSHMTSFANRKRVPSSIKEGDWVFLKIWPYVQHSMPACLHPKLAA